MHLLVFGLDLAMQAARARSDQGFKDRGTFISGSKHYCCRHCSDHFCIDGCEEKVLGKFWARASLVWKLVQ